MSIFTKIFNRLGYAALAERYPGSTEPQGARWDRTCVQFGSMRYRWCVCIVVAEGGLWLQARPPLQGVQAAMFVPWSEIREARPVLLYWRSAVRLVCGEPEVGRITVWRPVWDRAAPLWGATQQDGVR